MKLGHNLSLNALQLMLNQLFGLVIFYLLSAGLNKTDFGQINLALAILLAVFNILSLGIDQLVIRKIAAGAPVMATLSLYLVHVLIAGFSFYALLLISGPFFGKAEVWSLIALIGIGKLFIFLSSPFKQVVSGMEHFRLLACMSVVSNLIRCAGLLILALLQLLSVKGIIMVFIAGDLAELFVCFILFRQLIRKPLSITWDTSGYKKLLKESLPQTGVVVITSALARFDWIFIGFILSAVKLAEYSFAYKVFEIATFPMLAIAPLLIPLFTRWFRDQDPDTAKLQFLIRAELVVAAFSLLLLNLCWTPVVDALTSGKYGEVNSKTIFILSLCMPLLYVNNFLWTISFAQGRLHMILNSFVITLLVNIAADLLFIPLYQNEGAAVAFLLSCLAQTIFYLYKNNVPLLYQLWKPLLLCTGSALLSARLAGELISGFWMVLLCSVLLYVLLLALTAQLRLGDRENLRQLMKW